MLETIYGAILAKRLEPLYAAEAKGAINLTACESRNLRSGVYGQQRAGPDNADA